MAVGNGRHEGLGVPFGYHLERDDALLTLHRANGSDLAAFSAVALDLFEVGSAVWEDAD